jgi:hypothetical protein
MVMLPALPHYDAARRALAAAVAIDEVKQVRDCAVAMRAYALQAKDRALEIKAAQIRLRAEVRLGEMLCEQKATVGLNKGALRRGTEMEPRDDRPTLAEAGIDKKLSARSRELAAIPAKEIDSFLADCEAWNRDLCEPTPFAESARSMSSVFISIRWIDEPTLKHERQTVVASRPFDRVAVP